LMILSIMVPELYNSNINEPGRIAAQVVSGVWFLWAGAIMKMGLDTRWLTTAANIWATAAIGLTLGAGLYFAAWIVTIIILINLVLISKIKKYFFNSSRNCVIDIDVLKKHSWAERFHHQLEKLPIHIISKNIQESKNNVHIHIVSKIKKDINIFKLKGQIQKIAKIEKISISENLKQK
jgi:putative Mg2+ transporter-C (MgtC) family protein